MVLFRILYLSVIKVLKLLNQFYKCLAELEYTLLVINNIKCSHIIKTFKKVCISENREEGGGESVLTCVKLNLISQI